MDTRAEAKAPTSCVVNNNRFLILPWVRVRNLASSRLLACTLKRLVRDWPALYDTDPFQGEEAVCPMQFFFQRSPWDDQKML